MADGWTDIVFEWPSAGHTVNSTPETASCVWQQRLNSRAYFADVAGRATHEKRRISGIDRRDGRFENSTAHRGRPERRPGGARSFAAQTGDGSQEARTNQRRTDQALSRLSTLDESRTTCSQTHHKGIPLEGFQTSRSWLLRQRLPPLTARPCPAKVLQDGELLPDLAREPGSQVLHVIHRVEQHGVLEALDIERGDLADESQRFAAVIQIPVQLEGGHLAAWRRSRRLAARKVALRVLCQLVHVHDMRHRAQLVDGLERAMTFDAVLPTHQEKYRRPDKNH